MAGCPSMSAAARITQSAAAIWTLQEGAHPMRCILHCDRISSWRDSVLGVETHRVGIDEVIADIYQGWQREGQA